MKYHAAIDLGASSGRVAVGIADSESIEYQVIHRFKISNFTDPNHGLVWDWQAIESDVLRGLRLARASFPIASVGVDSWGVDYRLYGENGNPRDPVICYRNERLAGVMDLVMDRHGRERIYAATGIQFLPFNTIYQLAVAIDRGELANAATFLMLPDAMNRFLCGSMTQDVTNASTTQLLNARNLDWDWSLISDLGIPSTLFPKLHRPGTILGSIRGHGELDGIPVIAVGSHDTASAVAAVPFQDEQDAIFISSGTWSLIGYERDKPNISADALRLNLTNELGVQGKYRTLRNVAGMWLLSECQREWQSQGQDLSVDDLIAAAADVPGGQFIINPNGDEFIAPGNMVNRIAQQARSHGGTSPSTPGEIARCIFDSLAYAYRNLIEEFESIEGRRSRRIHIVGGASANQFLNQLIADTTVRQVISGPIEATLLGNIAIQAMALGRLADIQEFRRVLAQDPGIRAFTPSVSPT